MLCMLGDCICELWNVNKKQERMSPSYNITRCCTCVLVHDDITRCCSCLLVHDDIKRCCMCLSVHDDVKRCCTCLLVHDDITRCCFYTSSLTIVTRLLQEHRWMPASQEQLPTLWISFVHNGNVNIKDYSKARKFMSSDLFLHSNARIRSPSLVSLQLTQANRFHIAFKMTTGQIVEVCMMAKVIMLLQCLIIKLRPQHFVQCLSYKPTTLLATLL